MNYVQETGKPKTRVIKTGVLTIYNTVAEVDSHNKHLFQDPNLSPFSTAELSYSFKNVKPTNTFVTDPSYK